MKYRLKHVVEYAALRGAGGLIRILPYRIALGLVWCLAMASLPFLGGLMRRTRSRLRQVFGPRFTDRELARIARRAWRNLCFNAVETLRIPRLTADWVRNVTDPRVIPAIQDLIKNGSGLVAAVPHMGNWDFAGVGASLLGVPLFTIVRRQKNPLTDRFMNRMREYTGMEAIYTGSKALAGITGQLKQGKVLAILPDLRAKAESVRVNFLGSEAEIPNGMAHFAREAGVPILPVCCLRIGWARHACILFEPIWPDPSLAPEADWKRMTQYVMDCIDHTIREHPDQYFWFNKRWVLGKEGAGDRGQRSAIRGQENDLSDPKSR